MECRPSCINVHADTLVSVYTDCMPNGHSFCIQCIRTDYLLTNFTMFSCKPSGAVTFIFIDFINTYTIVLTREGCTLINICRKITLHINIPDIGGRHY